MSDSTDFKKPSPSALQPRDMSVRLGVYDTAMSAQAVGGGL